MDGVDGARLKQLREAAGWDAKVLAIRVSLSREQVEQIENGGHDLFYNVAIKRACARKLALALGTDPNSVITPLASTLTAPLSNPALVGVPTWQDNAHDGLQPERLNGPLTAMWVCAGLALTMMVLGVTFGGWGESAQPMWQQWRANWQAWQPSVWGVNGSAAATDTAQLLDRSTASRTDASATAAASAISASPVPAPPSLTQAPAPINDAGLDCPRASADAPVVQPLKAFKPGHIVFVQAVGDAHLCLRDHGGQVWSVNFKAGQERSFQGVPPWTVQSPSLAQFNVFFQGWKLRLPTDTQQSVSIVELQR
jgi:transcriptional regulator with XRE-family HTH domain